jgi:hypothetical protein
MNRPQFLAVSFMLLLVPGGYAGAQVAGSSRVGITIEETRAVAIGWSAKKQILRQPVYNEQKQKVGIVDDLIIAPDTAVSFVIIGAGGFVGLGRHDVAIPVNHKMCLCHGRRRRRYCATDCRQGARRLPTAPAIAQHEALMIAGERRSRRTGAPVLALSPMRWLDRPCVL